MWQFKVQEAKPQEIIERYLCLDQFALYKADEIKEVCPQFLLLTYVTDDETNEEVEVMELDWYRLMFNTPTVELKHIAGKLFQLFAPQETIKEEVNKLTELEKMHSNRAKVLQQTLLKNDGEPVEQINTGTDIEVDGTIISNDNIAGRMLGVVKDEDIN